MTNGDPHTTKGRTLTQIKALVERYSKNTLYNLKAESHHIGVGFVKISMQYILKPESLHTGVGLMQILMQYNLTPESHHIEVDFVQISMQYNEARITLYRGWFCANIYAVYL